MSNTTTTTTSGISNTTSTSMPKLPSTSSATPPLKRSDAAAVSNVAAVSDAEGQTKWNELVALISQLNDDKLACIEVCNFVFAEACDLMAQVEWAALRKVVDSFGGKFPESLVIQDAIKEVDRCLKKLNLGGLPRKRGDG